MCWYGSLDLIVFLLRLVWLSDDNSNCVEWVLFLMFSKEWILEIWVLLLFNGFNGFIGFNKLKFEMCSFIVFEFISIFEIDVFKTPVSAFWFNFFKKLQIKLSILVSILI